MLAQLFTIFCRLSPSLRRLIWRQWYEFLAGRFEQKDWSFMNYGYAPLDPHVAKLHLDEADEPNRYCIQLYHHVANAVNLKNSEVLEVSSGRGGGSYYIKGFLGPQSVIGVDYSEQVVAFCNANYVLDGLSFVTGDAELLPFGDSSFDAVVNVESSHCYGSMDAFLMEVKRVLRHHGYFLYADLRGRGRIDTLYQQLRRSGMNLIKETNITPHVLQALDLDNERKTALIRQSMHKFLLHAFLEFAAVKGSRIYEGFRAGDLMYLSFVLQKQKE